MEHRRIRSGVLPRVVPTETRSRGLRGSWKLNGEMVQMGQEPGTGVLIALDSRGNRVNPLRVISHGSKIDG